MLAGMAQGSWSSQVWRVLEARPEGSRVWSVSEAPGVHAPSNVTAPEGRQRPVFVDPFPQSFWHPSGARRHKGSRFPGAPRCSTPGYLRTTPPGVPELEIRASPEGHSVKAGLRFSFVASLVVSLIEIPLKSTREPTKLAIQIPTRIPETPLIRVPFALIVRRPPRLNSRWRDENLMVCSHSGAEATRLT